MRFVGSVQRTSSASATWFATARILLECVRRSAAWDVVLAGDWDLAMFDHDATQWTPTINEHIEWIRNEFRAASDSAALLDTLSSFRRSLVEDGRHFTHGTARLRARVRLSRIDVYDPNKLNGTSPNQF